MQSTLLHVLLIESGDIDAVITEGLLVNNPIIQIEVTRVRLLEEALAYLKCSPVDVVLLGISDSLGLDALQQLQHSAAELPVVVLTSDVDAEVGLQAIQLGAQDVLSKSLISGSHLVQSMVFASARQSKLKGLRDAAHVDQLTELSNRRCFIETFNALVSSERVGKAEHCLALLDIDHFKMLNDNYGHLGGDLALRHLGKILHRELADNNRVFRYGGEEFALLLAMPLDVARWRLEQLLKTIEADAIEVESQRMKVTASIGVTCVLRSDTYQQALQRCDEALYSAKARGRNQVITAEDCIAHPRMLGRALGHRAPELQEKRRQIYV